MLLSEGWSYIVMRIISKKETGEVENKGILHMVLNSFNGYLYLVINKSWTNGVTFNY
jgi:predicted glycosyltransferase